MSQTPSQPNKPSRIDFSRDVIKPQTDDDDEGAGQREYTLAESLRRRAWTFSDDEIKRPDTVPDHGPDF